MSIQTELARLTNAKAAIRSAIEGKGVTVPSGTLLDGMAALIESIEAGGGWKSYKIVSGYLASTSTESDGTFTFNHGLGCTPILFVMARPANNFSINNGDFSLVIYYDSYAEESLHAMSIRGAAKRCLWYHYRSSNNSGTSDNIGSIDSNSISVPPYKNGSFTAKVNGQYTWFAIGIDGE